MTTFVKMTMIILLDGWRQIPWKTNTCYSIPHETSRSGSTLCQGKGDCDRSCKRAIWETNQKARNNMLPKKQILKIIYRKQWQLVAELTMISLMDGWRQIPWKQTHGTHIKRKYRKQWKLVAELTMNSLLDRWRRLPCKTKPGYTLKKKIQVTMKTCGRADNN